MQKMCLNIYTFIEDESHYEVWKYGWCRFNPGFVLRLVSTQENYPWIGTDKKIFLCMC